MSLPQHLVELAAKMEAHRLGAMRDVTPEGYGPSTEEMETVYPKVQTCRNETIDEAMAREVGWRVEEGRAKFTEGSDGWKCVLATVYGPRVFYGYKKQDVINLVWQELNPPYGVPVAKAQPPSHE